MEKKPTIPPRHRAYPRSPPVPVHRGAAPTAGDAATAQAGTGWKRTVPEHRTFPRGG